MFERFTDSARRVVVLAQEEARLLSHNYIGTEHVLLGLIAERASVAAQVLGSLDVDLDDARAQVLEIIGHGGGPPSGHIPFTPRAKKVLELALREAMQLGHNYIGTEHILLGLCREGEGVGAQVLGAFGLDLGRVRNAVLMVLSGHGAETGRDPSAPQRLPWGNDSSRPRCLLCGRSERRVRHLLVSRGMSLCDECVRDAAVELDELAEDAPTRVRFRRRYPGPDDQLAAMIAIEQAVTAVFGRDAVDESLWAVEDGAELRAELQTMKDAAEYSRLVVNDIALGMVDFLDDTQAQVTLALWTIGSSSPLTMPVHVTLQDGTWKVSRSTMEDFAQASRWRRRPD